MNSNPGWLLHSVVLISLVIRIKTSSVNHFPCPYAQRFESCKIEEIIIHPCNQGLFDRYCNLYLKQPIVIVVIWTSPMKCKKATWNLYAHLPNGYQSIINDTNACNYTKCPFDGKRRMLIYDFQIPDLLKSQVYEFMMVLKSGKGNHACCTCFRANVNKDIELRSRSDETINSIRRMEADDFWNYLTVLSTSPFGISTDRNGSMTSS